MNLMKTLLGAAAATLVLGGASVAQEVTLRVHQMLPPQAVIPAKALVPWAEKVTAESDGAIQVEHYGAMTLGGAPPQLFDQAKDGVVDVIWTVLGYTPGRFPKSEVFELPFMVADAESTSVAFQEYVETYAMDEFEEVKLLAVHTHGPGLFHMKDAVTSLEDLQGRKIRGGSRIINEMLVSLGAEPIGMPVPAVPEALSSGVIEGTTIPWEVTSALHTSELVENHTGFTGDRGLYTQTFAVVMNKATYEGLSDEAKAVIDANSGVEFAAALGRAMDGGDAAGLKIAQDLGNNIITLDEAETARWKAKAQEIVARWVSDTDNGQDLYDAAVALVEKHTGM